MSHACHRFCKCYKTLTFCSLLTRCRIPGACLAKRHLNVQEWSEPVSFTLLTSKCASRHNGVHIFDISTSNSGPNVRFFLAFSLTNVLRATTACNFSSLIWPAGSAPAALASLLFDPPEPQIIGKTQYFATSQLFAHLHLLSSDSFSSLIFSLLLFSSLWLFPSLLFICPYCRKLDF